MLSLLLLLLLSGKCFALAQNSSDKLTFEDNTRRVFSLLSLNASTGDSDMTHAVSGAGPAPTGADAGAAM